MRESISILTYPITILSDGNFNLLILTRWSRLIHIQIQTNETTKFYAKNIIFHVYYYVSY